MENDSSAYNLIKVSFFGILLASSVKIHNTYLKTITYCFQVLSVSKSYPMH